MEDMDARFLQIQDQLQKVIEGMTSINDHNTQTDKELFEIKEVIGYMSTRGREREPNKVEFSNARTCSIECPHENRPREMHNGVSPIALSERFGERFENPIEELNNLHQISTVKEYQAEFDRLLTRKPFESNRSIVNNFNGNNPERGLTIAEMDEKRAKGLCFSCDEKYVVGHICKAKKQIFLVDVIEDEAKSELVELEQKVRDETNEFMTISLQAFIGVTGYQTIRWLLQGTTFASDFLLLPLGNVDIVLGVQWLNTLGRILFDFSNRTIEFMYQGKKHVLKGASSQLKATKARALNKIDEEDAQFFMMSLLQKGSEVLSCHNIQVDQGMVVSLQLSVLIDQFASIFAIPTTLPPHRGLFDHRIPLLECTNPVNKRPYRYLGVKKDIIEKLVQEMLDQGIVQHSTSSYASHVVLVGKKDGSWRLCVDYRALNQLTIKDKFPIPIIKDLLDELGGAVVFSKIDLRVVYHQLRMASGDTHKTTFKTHEGHYEFLVMSFGLTNAPSSFQSLMSVVFKPLLRKSVLQFQLCSKQSKCAFGVHRVEYLGYFITDEWVSTDPRKIELKQALIYAPVLAMPDYCKPFLVETDASGKGIGVVLMQQGHPIAYISKGNFVFEQLKQALISAPVLAMPDYCKPFLVEIDAFLCKEEATLAFEHLKQTLISTLVLAMPDYCKPFLVETDFSGKGIGVVLMQQGHPIAYISKLLAPKHQAMSVYDRELLAHIFAVTKWSHYLLSRPFIVKTDQKAFKYLLEQKIHTDFQVAGISKLMAFDFSIEYKKGVENKVADVLSRKPDAELLGISLLTPNDSLWKGRLVVGNDRLLRKNTIKLWHDSTQGGVQLQRSTAYHPQTDGQTEAYRMVFILTISRMVKPPIHLPYIVGETANEMVDRSLATREAILQLLKFYIGRAQQRMKGMADKHRPYLVEAKVGAVAYKLLMPADVRIHPTFFSIILLCFTFQVLIVLCRSLFLKGCW
ncbi:hypothetical protein KY284_035161 [Solanum tuberosum]|nr:hypothetical protein KY284_035161 [Solanum tuberosum]